MPSTWSKILFLHYAAFSPQGTFVDHSCFAFLKTSEFSIRYAVGDTAMEGEDCIVLPYPQFIDPDPEFKLPKPIVNGIFYDQKGPYYNISAKPGRCSKRLGIPGTAVILLWRFGVF